MIYLNINNSDYYDEVLVLVKAFFPAAETATDFADGEQDFFKVTVEGCRLDIAARIDGVAYERTALAVTADKRDIKNTLKDCLYRLLCEITGSTLPWGMLTGVRPAKIVMKLLEEGRSAGEIEAYVQEQYLVSRNKARLSVAVAQKEKELLQRLNYDHGYSLYVGIPFCPTTCLYCSFTSYPVKTWKARVDSYLDALIQEMESISSYFKGRGPDTIYFGGGTPTTLEPWQLDRLLTALKTCFDLTGTLELTIEAGRPDSITKEKLMVLKKHGADRISINPQTMKQETLDIIGRLHTVEQVREAYFLARECGFKNINMDLIMGLPGETKEDVGQTLREIALMGPDSLTVHSLAVKRAAALKMWQKKNILYDSVNTDVIMDMTADYAAGMGLEPYYLYRQKNMTGNFENVGYSKKGYECLYNVLIMEEKQTIVACGAGGVSKRVYPGGRIERCENVKDVAGYIERIEEMIERKRVLLND